VAVYGMKRNLQAILQPFSMGRLQEAALIMRVLEVEGYGLRALERFLDFVRETIMRRRLHLAAEQQNYLIDFDRHAPKCPDCGKPMFIASVNNGPGEMIGGSAKSMWCCADMMKCGGTIESERTVAEEIRRVGVPYPTIAANPLAAPVDPKPCPERAEKETTTPTRARGRARRKMAAEARRGAARRRGG
jgi:hypothetical protein